MSFSISSAGAGEKTVFCVFINCYLLLSTGREGRFRADLFLGMRLSGYLVSIFNGCECVTLGVM